jgi:hypothetical protein
MKSIKINPLTHFSKTIIAICLSAATLICFVSCDKDKDETEQAKTKSELLKQKWNVVKQLDTFVDPSVNYYIYKAYTGKAGDYYDFGTDGTLNFEVDGQKWSDPYKFTESTMSYTFYSVTYHIIELTEHKLEIYKREDHGPGHFSAQRVFLER